MRLTAEEIRVLHTALPLGHDPGDVLVDLDVLPGRPAGHDYMLVTVSSRDGQQLRQFRLYRDGRTEAQP